MSVWDALIVAGITGAVSSLSTIAAVRTDIQWLKQSLNRAHKRIDDLQKMITFGA